MAEIGTAYVTLLPSAKGFGTAVEKEVGSSGTKAGATAGRGFKGSFTKGLAGMGTAVAGAFAVDKVVSFFKSSVDEARESQKVSAITAQVIKTTGSAAGVSAGQVGTLATAISNKTGIDDEAIQTGANLLLTFKNIKDEAGKGNDIFDQTTSIMTDMAAAMGKDPKSAAIGLGKALNDPVKGITALSRVGVSFDEQQVKTIKHMVASGNTMGAQKIILKELKSEFGGTAAASATAGEKASVAFGNLKEQIGTALLPVIDKVETILSDKVIPAVSDFLSGMQSGKGAGGQFADALERLWGAAKKVWPIIKAIGDFLLHHVTLIEAVAVAIGLWTLAEMAWNAVEAIKLGLLLIATPGTFLNAAASTAAAVATAVWAAAVWLLTTPLGLVVLAILALVVVIILVIKYHKQIGAFIGRVWGKIKDAIMAAVHAVVGFVKKVWGGLVGWIAGLFEKVRTAISKAWGKIKDTVSRAVRNVVAWVKSHWKVLASILGGPLVAAVILIVSKWGKIKEAFSKGLAAVRSLAARVWHNVVGIITGGVQTIVSAVAGIPGKLGALAGRFSSVGHSLIQAFVNGMRNAAGIVSGIAGNVWDTVRGLLNSAIGRINSALSFSISLPLGKHVTIDPPDIPALASGGRARGSLVEVGDGNRWESIIPDRLMGDALTAAASAGGELRNAGGSGLPNRLRLVVDGYEFNAYVDARADDAVASAGDLDAQRGRAAW